MLTGNRIRLAMTLAIGVLGGSACATQYQSMTAVDPEFAPNDVRSVAVLPFFEWQLPLDDTREMTDRTLAALRRRGTDVTVLTPDEAASLLIDAGLTYEWALYLNDERQGAIPDSTVIMRMSDALGADLIAHITLTDVFVTDGSTAFGGAYATATVELRLFDGRTGHPAWRAAATTEHEWRSWSGTAAALAEPLKWVFGAVLGDVPSLGHRSAP
jgi:hypothetical protein